MKSLDETRIEIRRHFDVENDDDVNVETKSLKVSLKCPIGKLLFFMNVVTFLVHSYMTLAKNLRGPRWGS